MKKVLIIGSSGTIGHAVELELKSDCEIIAANQSSGDVKIDLNDTKSIQVMYEEVGPIDAVICTAARGIVFKDLTELTRSDFAMSSESKLFGQIDLVLQGIPYLNPKGSFTLTTGVINQDPIPMSTAASMVNAGIEGFLNAAQYELPESKRINVVSPALVTEALAKYESFFQGYPTVAAAEVAKAYRKSVFGVQTGRIYHVGPR